MSVPVFVALDTVDLQKAIAWAKDIAAANAVALQSGPWGVKLGLEFFLHHGHGGYAKIAAVGLPIFLDLKLYDIPNTVAGGLRAILDLEPYYLTLHAGGGKIMMQRAVEELKSHNSATKLLGVTVLTSMDKADLEGIGVQDAPHVQVQRLAKLAEEAGMHGSVCSAHELMMLRGAGHVSAGFDLVVPGIRPAGIAAQDQKRVMTPKDAMQNGATALVIGRPITQAPSIAEAIAAIGQEMGAV